jgi:hypothetical protein
MKIRIDRFVRHAEKQQGSGNTTNGSSGQRRVHFIRQMVAVT